MSDIDVPVSDIDLVIRRSKKLEALLRDGAAARGRGLHELVSSADARNALPHHLVKRLRYIATCRNRVVHDTTVHKLDDRGEFVRACDQAEAELHDLFGQQDTWTTVIIVVLAVAAMLIVGVALSVWMLRSRDMPLWSLAG